MSQVVAADKFGNGLAQFHLGHLPGDSQLGGLTTQTVEVSGQVQGKPLIQAQGCVDAVTIHIATVEDTDAGLVRGDKSPIHINKLLGRQERTFSVPPP